MMFGLTRDFIQRDGVSMLLGRQDGLPANELNMVEARMLMNSGIPYHLRLLLREVDLHVTLEYAVSRRRMLSHLLKSEKLSMSDFFGLLLQIAQGMEEGRLYMLRPERYALHEDYIYIEGPLSSCKVYLTYIPLNSMPSEAAAGGNMRFLIMVLMASVTELAGNGVQRLLRYCGREDFSPAGLKNLLSELMTGGENIKRSIDTASPLPFIPPAQTVPSAAETTVNGQGNTRSMPEPKVPLWRSEQQEVSQNEAPWTRAYPRLKLKEEEALEEQDNLDTEDESDTRPSAYKTYVMLGSVLADALLWKFLYLDRPAALWLAVCTAVTLILAAFCRLIWSGRIVIGGNKAEDGADIDNNMADKKGKSHRELEWDFRRNAINPVRPAASHRTDQAPLEPIASLVSPFSSNRESRNPSEAGKGQQHGISPMAEAATALLPSEHPSGNERGGQRAARTAPYLERYQDDGNGDAEKIELDRPSFIIGRSPEVAQYVEPSEGASRVHAEISKSPAGYILKDLDSRNGTLYQGEAMVPYKEYPLTEGAEFTILKGHYTFRLA